MANFLFATYHFAPENTSGTHRGLHFARALHDAGHGVFVVTAPMPPAERADPSLNQVFPAPDRIFRVSPVASLGGVYLSLKRRWPSRPSVSGQRTDTRTPAPARDERLGLIAGVARQVAIWEALPDLQRPWYGPAVRTGLAIGRKERVDAVFASGPPWTGLMVGRRVAATLGVPFVADFRDPWTEWMKAHWHYPTEWAQRRARRFARRVIADASIVLFNSPRLAAVTAERNGLGARARTILNGSDVARSSAPVVLPPGSPLVFRHFGSLYAGRSIAQLAEALAALVAAGRMRADEIAIELVGVTPGSLEEQFGRLPFAIHGRPLVPFAEAAAAMARPSVLISLQNELHAALIPTKLFDYLGTGNPVLVVSPEASASWDVACGFARCRRLDVSASAHNDKVLDQMVRDWQGGRLRQERSIEDTEALTKASLGAQFVRLMEDTVVDRGAR